MSITNALAAGRKITQSVQVSTATVSVSTYDAAGAATARAVDKSPATSRLVIYRDGSGGIFVTRSNNTGGTIETTPRRCYRAEELFELLAEGLSTAVPEIGDKDAG